jgi:hypothetical protein
VYAQADHALGSRLNQVHQMASETSMTVA